MKRTAVFLCAALAALLLPFSTLADSAAFTIVDDSTLNSKVASARSRFLTAKPYVTRLDVCLLVPGDGGTWRRCSYNPTTISYPASCVKLAYLASSMYWCRTNSRAYDYLDQYVRPMIVGSSNVDTGHVVDNITGAPNYSTSTMDSTFWTWYDKRLYTENFLGARGLLDNMTIIHKTYPSNSGSSPSGAEQLAQTHRGGNRMQAKLSASIMLEVVKGAIEPGATGYMRELLCSQPWQSDSEFGFGLPPGAIYENKLGLAYDTLEDIAYITLPNGKEFILAAYSNGFVSPETAYPMPYDASLLGMFAEILYEELGFDAGLPPRVKIDNTSAAVTVSGSWDTGTDKNLDYDMFGDNYRYTTSDLTGTKSVTWNLNAPEDGLYEICVFYPQKSAGTSAVFTVNHASGASNVTVDQRYCGGRWYRLGDFRLNAGQGSVILTNKASTSGKTIIADAVKISKWPESTNPVSGTDVVIDNDHGSPWFSTTGSWSSNSFQGRFGKSYRYANAGAASTATWTATLSETGEYDVYVTHRAAHNRAASARFTVNASDGVHDVNINQTENILTWVHIGRFPFNAGQNTVTLNAAQSAGGRVIADAIRFVLSDTSVIEWDEFK